MRVSRSFVLLIFSLLMISACATPIHAVRYHSDKSFRPRDMRDKRVAVIVNPRGYLKGFSKSFHKVYESNQAFADDLRGQLIQKQSALSWALVAVKVPLDDKQLEIFLQSYSRNRLDWLETPESYQSILAQTFEDTDVDYIIVVSSWEINETWSQSSNQQMGAFGEMTTTSSSIKVCHVNLEGGLIDASGRTLVFGQATGQSEVISLTSKTTMRQGIDQATTHLIQLLNGTMKSANISDR